MAEQRSSRRRKDREGLASIFRDERHSGRLPDILQPNEPAQEPPASEPEPTPQPPQPTTPVAVESLTPSEPLIYQPDAATREPRRRGARLDKQSGLHLVRQDIIQHGVPYPGRDSGFLMEPYNFMRMMLTLEKLAVVQVVHEILGRTLGQEEPSSPTGRRQWCKLSLRDLKEGRNMSHSQAQRGIKEALASGYIQRRQNEESGYEYAIRWRNLESDMP